MTLWISIGIYLIMKNTVKVKIHYILIIILLASTRIRITEKGYEDTSAGWLSLIGQ